MLTLLTAVAATRAWPAEPNPARTVTGQTPAYAPPGPYRGHVQSAPDTAGTEPTRGDAEGVPEKSRKRFDSFFRRDTDPAITARHETAPEAAAGTMTTGGEPSRQAGRPIAPEALSAAPVGTGARAEQRLYQLKVLQELLDDGLLSADEEQRIRRRILAAGQ